MKLLHSLAIAALLAGSAGIASAGTITLNSYGQVNCNPNCAPPAPTYAPPTFSSQNTVTMFTGGVDTATTPSTPVGAGTTYDINNGGGVWAGPIGASSWVSQNPGNSPTGGNVEPTGTYDYSTTFTTTGTATGGSLEVLADDTTNVILNGLQIVPAAAGVGSNHCTVGAPNCEVIYTIDFTNTPGSAVDTTYVPLSDIASGLNTLSFDVNQDFGSAEGVDFSGSISTTPEPNTLVLLGTGALGLAGVMRKKFAV